MVSLPASSTRVAMPAVAAGLFLLIAALTAIWLWINFVFPGLNPSGIPSAVVRLTIHAAITFGVWLALTRTNFARSERVAVWLAIVVPFTAWLALVWGLAVDGAFVQPPGSPVPRIPLAIFLPLLLLIPLMRSRRVGTLLDATPATWLIALQVYRIFGGIFLVGWARGNLSGTFALPAGIGDVLVGLLALPVAYWLHAGGRGGRAFGIAWNVFGLIDFAIAIGVGILSSPGPLQLIVPEPPNALLGSYPSGEISRLRGAEFDSAPRVVAAAALAPWQPGLEVTDWITSLARAQATRRRQ